MSHISTTEFLVAWVVGALAGTAVFLHADRNGSRRASAWACAVFLCPGIAPLYALHVVRSRRRHDGT